ncbi:MAG: 2-amino-4-hydroxy-6-hydroxymethyldihydropteridine diphosphokinase [Gemmatimonadetes bacterium]|nr:2-amino-4-hydroxy-6-hydroxymethyldihydropteridine diphosphokinase [Gemmatimonadota bacterium]
MPSTELVFVALGSNLGDRRAHLEAARRKLANLPNTSVLAESAIEKTKPLGPIPQGKYLNQMLLLRTELPPNEVLEAGLEAEMEAGRVRAERWGPRTLDVDLVRFGDRVIREPHLTVPHPELPNRPFWLRELAELLLSVNGHGLPEWARVGASRRNHICRVAALVEAWGMAMSREPDERARWVRAAFLHDALRDAPEDELARLADRKWDVPGLYHGPAAARLAEEHGETDTGVLDAVRYHSVGYARWDDVGRMLYLADYLEPGRSFKRKKRAALAARVPRKPRGVLERVARKRMTKSQENQGRVIPEEVEFWNHLVGSS